MTTLGSGGAAAVAKPPPVNSNTTYSGSSDSTRYPGFRSLQTTPVPTPAPTGAAPDGAAPAAPELSPGMKAAMAASPNRKSALGTILGGVGFNTITGGLGGVGFNTITGGLFRHNASPIQDIAGALALGRTVSDASWRKAGFGPGGAALSPAPGNTRSTALSGINSASDYSAAFPQR